MVNDLGAQNQCMGSHSLNFQLKCHWVLLYVRSIKDPIDLAWCS